MRGLYVHIPFCVKKCSYCDFYSLPSRQDAIESYVQAVLREAESYSNKDCHSDDNLPLRKRGIKGDFRPPTDARYSPSEKENNSGLSFQTLYIGGGTPSLLGAKYLTALIHGLNKSLSLLVSSPLRGEDEGEGVQQQGEGMRQIVEGVQFIESTRHCDPSAEGEAISWQGGNPNSPVGSGFEPDRPTGGSLSLGLLEATIEVNPESATTEFLQTAKNLGFNRVSFGVQSLSDDELKSVGRIHTAAQAIAAIKQAQKLDFKAISADLIIGLPGQTWASLHTSLKTLVGMGIQHLSVYCLSLEEGTFLANNPPADLPSDDLQAKLFEDMRKYLNRCGYVHYEISNFALKGYECLHNLNYWRGGEYLGLGPAAASHLDGKRFKNYANLDAYLAEGPTGQTEYVEELRDADKAAEEAMLRLRLLEEGLDSQVLTSRFGQENAQDIFTRLDKMVKEGLLLHEGPKYRLTPSRILTSNPIFARVIADKE